VGTHFTLGKQILLVLSHTFEQKAKDKLEQWKENESSETCWKTL
jgi:hypothetical protein